MQLVSPRDPVLRQVAEAFEQGDEEAGELALAMLQVMHRSGGMGLAAPQVGVSKRLIVGHYPREGWGFQIVNPVITKRSKATSSPLEGCLSVPGKRGRVKRHRVIRVEGFSPRWEPLKFKATGWLSFCLQHEIDHLDGILFTDKTR